MTNDANLLNTQLSNPHTKTPIPGNPSKSDLIGMYQAPTLLEIETCPTNIDS